MDRAERFETCWGFPHNLSQVKKDTIKKWALFFLRWGIAVVGVYFVVTNINFYDRVLIYDEAARRPVDIKVVSHQKENTWPLRTVMADGSTREIFRPDILLKPSVVNVVRKSDHKPVHVLALKQFDMSTGKPVATQLLVAENKSGPGTWVTPGELTEPYVIDVVFPMREIGLIRMFDEADTRWLLAAVFVIPIVFLITGYRWWLLLKGLEVSMSLWTALQINMVGAFYNTFMPGSTGGDVLKAYYAAKNAPSMRTRAVLSVIVDRAIGLLALIIMGGFCAAFQWHIPQCRQIAMGAGVICLMLGLGVFVLGYAPVRKMLGFDWLISKLPMREKVDKTLDALRIYRKRPMLALVALLMSFPVHGTIVISAMFAGWAFGLPIHWAYYWVVVPTVVLSGALPISPQGAGVMEFFAILLTNPRGATVGQAVALTLSIRLVQIVWNLAAGVLVLVGGYHSPSEQEKSELDSGNGGSVERSGESSSVEQIELK